MTWKRSPPLPLTGLPARNDSASFTAPSARDGRDVSAEPPAVSAARSVPAIGWGGLSRSSESQALTSRARSTAHRIKYASSGSSTNSSLTIPPGNSL
ncbi:MAG: hypothetical protein ACLQCB_09240 [Spirochaetia bacterium]